jgi:hypothetical protein
MPAGSSKSRTDHENVVLQSGPRELRPVIGVFDPATDC